MLKGGEGGWGGEVGVCLGAPRGWVERGVGSVGRASRSVFVSVTGGERGGVQVRGPLCPPSGSRAYGRCDPGPNSAVPRLWHRG